MNHSPFKMLLSPLIISLISFFIVKSINACIVDTCICVLTPTTNANFQNKCIFFNVLPLPSPFFFVFPPHPLISLFFSARMETQRLRSCSTATMLFVMIRMRHCALVRWTLMRTCSWPASIATSTAGDPTNPLR